VSGRILAPGLLCRRWGTRDAAGTVAEGQQPTVIMWSCSNEVGHDGGSNSAGGARLYDEQFEKTELEEAMLTSLAEEPLTQENKALRDYATSD